MSKQGYLIWRINPEKKAIAPLLLDQKKKNFAIDIQRFCRAAVLGHKIVCKINDVSLALAADAQADEGQPGFRFKGIEGEPTAGIGVLFGVGEGGGLIASPANRAWIERHIVWTTPEETDADPADGSA